jgi:hypothetical protein
MNSFAQKKEPHANHSDDWMIPGLSAIRKSFTLTVCRLPAPIERVSWLGLDTDTVVHSFTNPLLAAEIAFSCLHGHVPEKELDLIQFPT